MILQNIITTSLERGKNDDDDVTDLKTFLFYFDVANLCSLFCKKQIKIKNLIFV